MNAEEAIALLVVDDRINGSLCGHTGCTDHPEIDKVVHVRGPYTSGDWYYEGVINALRLSPTLTFVERPYWQGIEFPYKGSMWSARARRDGQ